MEVQPINTPHTEALKLETQPPQDSFIQANTLHV